MHQTPVTIFSMAPMPVYESSAHEILQADLHRVFASCAAAADPPATAPIDPMEALEAKTLYYPRAYDTSDIDSFIHDGGLRVDYKTAQGKQTAWLIAPAKGVKAEHLWAVCGGNRGAGT